MTVMTDAARSRPRYISEVWLWTLAVAFILVGIVILWLVPEQLLNHWVVADDPGEQRKLLGTAAQIVLFGLGGIIAVVGVVLSLARHGQSLDAAERERKQHAFEVDKEEARRTEFQSQQSFIARQEKRRIAESNQQRRADQERELRSRFVTAVDLLSDTAPIKRSAGLYALAALADDWIAARRSDEAQVCVDVLCGYLRAEAPTIAELLAAEADVRRTGYEVIRAHLLAPIQDGPSWTGMTFSLTGAPIWFTANLLDLECVSGTNIIFDGCRLSADATIDLRGLRIGSGSRLSFARAELQTGSSIMAPHAHIEGGRFNMPRALIGERAALTMNDLTLSDGGVLNINRVTCGAGGGVMLDGLIVRDESQVKASGIELQPRSVLTFPRARFEGGSSMWLEHSTIGESSHLVAIDVAVGDATLWLNSVAVSPNATLIFDRSTFSRDLSLCFDNADISPTARVSFSGVVFGANALKLPDGRGFGSKDQPLPMWTVLEVDGVTTRMPA